MYYVYADVNLNTMVPFYYGSGGIERIIDDERNKAHNDACAILNKNWKRFILHESNSRQECYDIEKIYIALSFDARNKINGRILTNKIVDSQNFEEIADFKNKPKIGNTQPKTPTKFKGKIFKNRKYFVLEHIGSCNKLICTKITHVLNFKTLNLSSSEKADLINITTNKWSLKQGFCFKGWHIQLVNGTVIAALTERNISNG